MTWYALDIIVVMTTDVAPIGMCTIPTIVPIHRSLLATCPLYRIIGDLPLTNQHTKFILTHKYFLIRPTAHPHTLVGYLMCSPKRIPLLNEALKLCLAVWGSASSLRHMSDEQHMKISSLIVLSITCISTRDASFLSSEVIKWMVGHW